MVLEAVTAVGRIRGSVDEDGQTLVEYGLLLALVPMIVMVDLVSLGPIVSQIFPERRLEPSRIGS